MSSRTLDAPHGHKYCYWCGSLLMKHYEDYQEYDYCDCHPYKEYNRIEGEIEVLRLQLKSVERLPSARAKEKNLHMQEIQRIYSDVK